jgi:UDP-N-acetylmuramyl pentapeptide phosphotransferase/UDP-N-acetylglucosamine-1-phosphate transferase
MILEFLLIFIGALVMIGLVRSYAPKIGLIDIPNDRSAHTRHTPRGAGVGFYLSSALIIPLFHFDLILAYKWTFLAVFLVFVVGVLDDHHDTSPKTNLL